MNDMHDRSPRHWPRLASAVACATLLGACADTERIEPPAATTTSSHTVSFVGYSYDGASGTRLDSYAIDAQVADVITDGSVDGEGRYSVGTISPWDDFTITIVAEGYRDFLSHNGNIGLPVELANSNDISETSSHQTLHFDAYLFPSALQSPAVTFTITTTVGTDPSGNIRFRPTAPSLLNDQNIDTPSGVPGQSWINDEDLQGSVLNQAFSSGTFTLNAGELVYGVNYQVDIYDVVGYQPFTGTYTAGVETNKTFTLVEEVAEPLVVNSSTHLSCTPPSSPNETSGATVVMDFNHQIEFSDISYPGGPQEALDDFISIVSPNTDADTTVNALNTDGSDTTQERGVSAIPSGNTLTINWDPSTGLLTKDADDAITQVTYSNLGNVQIQRVGSPTSAQTLSTLLGVASITCD